MGDARKLQSPGPFRSDQIRSGDPYELSGGHPLVCLPTGRDGTEANGLGFAVVRTDPAVHNAGVDTGIALEADTLRAPDVAVNFVHAGGTWATSAPLALEYAGRGQNEGELATKIGELLARGTRWVWVMRLVGPRRVEVHEAGAAVRIVNIDGELTAPGVLSLPVPVRALFEPDAAFEVTLRNLLSARGYVSLDAVRDEGRNEGRNEGLEDLRTALRGAIEARGWTPAPSHLARIGLCREADVLMRLITRVVADRSLEDVFAEPLGGR